MGSSAEGHAVTTSLSASSARMAGASPVFIVGHARSGTSLLFRTLQQHPEFAPRRMSLHETQLFARLAAAFRFDANPPRQLRSFMLNDDEHFQAFLDETRAIRRAAAVSAPLAVPLRGDLPLAVWKAQRLHLVARSYLSHAWSARGARRLVEKSPRNTPHLDKIRLVSPDSRMLFMSRHPIDVYSSYRKRSQDDPGSRSWTDISPRRFARIYRSAVRRAVRDAEHGNAMLVVKYEDFTADPEGQFRRVCDFVQAPFDASALEGASSQSLKAQPDQHLHGAITARTKAWSDYLTADEARRIESWLAPEMHRLQYESATG